MGWSRSKKEGKRVYPWQRRRRRLFFVLILILLPLVALVNWRVRDRMETERLLQGLRNKGIPVTIQELQASYPKAPDAENAARLYREALDGLQPITPDAAAKIPFTRFSPKTGVAEPYSEAMRGSIESFLQENGKALGRLHEAAGMTKCSYPLDLRPSRFMRDDRPSGLTALALPLEIEMAWAAETGDLERATAAWEALWALVRSFEGNPAEPMALARLSILEDTNEVLERALSRAVWSDAFLSRMEEAVKKSHAPDALRQWYAASLCADLWRLDEAMGAGPFHRIPARVLGGVYMLMGSRDAAARHLINVYAALLEHTEAPYRELHALEKEAQFSIHRDYRFLARYHVGPNLAAEAFASAGIWLCLMETALAVERFRDANRALPESLDALVPALMSKIPEDPFGGKPMRYGREPVGYAVWNADVEPERVSSSRRGGSGSRGEGGGSRAPDFLLRIER